MGNRNRPFQVAASSHFWNMKRRVLGLSQDQDKTADKRRAASLVGSELHRDLDGPPSGGSIITSSCVVHLYTNARCILRSDPCCINLKSECPLTTNCKRVSER